MKKRLPSFLLSAVLALSLLPAPVRASYPVDTVVDGGAVMRLTGTGEDVPFTYPKTGTTVLIFYRDDQGSVSLLEGLARCDWAADERLNVVAADVSGQSGKAVRQRLSGTGAESVVDLAYYNDGDNPANLCARYGSLLGMERGAIEYPCVLILQTVFGYRCIRSCLNGAASAGAVRQELGKWVELPPEPVTEPVITAQPQDTAAAAGGTATFRVTAEGQELNYRWYARAPGRGGWTAATAQGSRTAELTVSATMVLNGARYRCEVWNDAGSVTSDEAALTVKEIVAEPPAIREDVYRIGELSLHDTDGRPLTGIPRGCFRVTVPITKLAETSGTMVILAAYTTTGRYVFLMKAYLKDDSVGQMSTFVFPVNNTNGTITKLAVFPIASLQDPTLRGEPAEYPAR